MKSLLITGVAALGLLVATGPTTAEAGCGYGYGSGLGYGYGSGLGVGFGNPYGFNSGFAPVYRSPAYVPVGRSRGLYRPVGVPVYPRGYRGFGRRDGVIISTPGFGVRFGF